LGTLATSGWARAENDICHGIVTRMKGNQRLGKPFDTAALRELVRRLVFGSRGADASRA
jgi:hypothetical protein